MSRVRVRFAPSPTGHLHVGGARTALFNWLFAKNQDGEFLLRIEDTDIERSSEEMVESIMESLQWLGIEWDEEPMFQSRRLERHRQIAMDLMDSGKAYPCFCKPDRMRENEQLKSAEKTYLYPRTCLAMGPQERRVRIDAGDKFAVRFFVPEGRTCFEDLVYGSNSVEHHNIDDFVLLRRDGTPTYQLAVVVDDIDMEITHVIRGEGHLSNTPKQILLYNALGKRVPCFAHLPLILGSDKKPLAKRHGATSIASYRDMGFLPRAVVNFLALLGWSPGDDREVLSVEELVERFSLDRVIRKGAVFDIQKLEWLNGQYISSSRAEEIYEEVSRRWVEADLLGAGDVQERKDWLLALIDLLKSRMRLLSDFVEAAKPYLTEDFPYEEGAVKKRWKKPEEVMMILNKVGEVLRELDDFSSESIEEKVRAIAEALDVSNSKVIHPVRVALTGRAAGPGLFELMEVIGREGCIKRLARAVNHIEGMRAEEQGA